MRHLLFILLASSAMGADLTTTDVCIYGGTSGGVIAAVEAARLGKKSSGREARHVSQS